ncbi:MAG: twin-arginine translocation pathway signal [Rhodoferax sp.]
MFRRLFLGACATLVLALGLASGGCALGPRADLAPIVFVHGNGDSAAVWQTTLWRFESNGWPRERLFALQQPYPLARDVDAKEQAGRSSSAEHMAFLKAEVDKVLAKTGAKQVVLVGNSRGGYAIRNYIQNGGGDKTVSHAILGGTPNHGVWAIPGYLEGSEFSGTGAFLKSLNAPKNAAGDEVSGPVKWLTIRSDSNDKYSQPDGEWIGAKGKPTRVGYDNPALKGAQNVVLARIDHRETSFSPAAFEVTYRFITGQEPVTLKMLPEPSIVLDGMVTGKGVQSTDAASASNNFSNNLPVSGAKVEVYAVDYDNGLRVGAAVHVKTVGDDGRWGPFKAATGVPYEFVISAPGYAKTHIYRSAFPRGSEAVHLKAERIADADLPAFSIIQLVRPRGYLDPTTHFIAFDGQTPPPGVAIARVAGVASSKINLATLQNRAIFAEFHTDAVEQLVGRTWPAKENHLVFLEITQ